MDMVKESPPAELDLFSLADWSAALMLSERTAGWRAAGPHAQPEDARQARVWVDSDRRL